MSWTTRRTPARKGSCTLLALSVAALAVVVGCGDTVPVFNGSGGSFGTGGTGASGTGGSGATGGFGGTGATGGSGGAGGTGASSGSGGFGGFGGSADCLLSALCRECPTSNTCTEDSQCGSDIAGVCVDTGCKTLEAEVIGQCQTLDGPPCSFDLNDCPSGYECAAAGGRPDRCIRVADGCEHTRDCPRGFYCEDGSCKDRRVPCLSTTQCPHSHFCNISLAAKFCERVYRDCDNEGQCPGGRCIDVEDDGRTECAPELSGTDEACENAACGGSTPICELGLSSVLASCGDYGLCNENNDCGPGFVCATIWPSTDGRRECVPSGGCTSISDCPERQVCAASRDGGAPSCQAGFVGPSP